MPQCGLTPAGHSLACFQVHVRHRGLGAAAASGQLPTVGGGVVAWTGGSGLRPPLGRCKCDERKCKQGKQDSMETVSESVGRFHPFPPPLMSET